MSVAGWVAMGVPQWRTAADEAAQLTDEEQARCCKTREVAERVMSRHADSFSALASSDTSTQVKDPLPVPAASQAFVTKDSGQREQWATGSQRDSREGKGRFDLIPSEPMRRLAQLYARGAEKYNDRNWERGQPLSRYLDSMIRHAFDFAGGEATEDHLAAVAWNAFALMATQEWIKSGRLPAELDDLPKCDDKHTESTDSGAERQVEPGAGRPLPNQDAMDRALEHLRTMSTDEFKRSLVLSGSHTEDGRLVPELCAERQVEPPTVGEEFRRRGFNVNHLVGELGWSLEAATGVMRNGLVFEGGAGTNGATSRAQAIADLTETHERLWLDIQRKRDEWEARQK